jgi:hypothetical protein
MRYNGFWVLAAFLLVLFSSPQVHAIPVDLSSFDIIDDTVDIFGPDNSSAKIAEDPFDPLRAPVGLWEPLLDIPADAFSLSFDYKLVVAPNNEDYFDFYFGDLSSPSDWFGGYNNSAAADLIFAGTITEDLTGFAGGTLPIAFALSSGWDDGYSYEVVDEWGYPTYVGDEYASNLTITNVEINPVPEPATLLLLGSGLLGIIGFRKRKVSGTT